MTNVSLPRPLVTPRLFWVASAIPGDTGGGSPYDKLAVMAAVASFLDLRHYLEIGVWHGRSFFPLASSFAARGGHSYGIDPYRTDAARQRQMPAPIATIVDAFIGTCDYEAVFRNVVKRQQRFGLTEASTLLRHTSEEAAELLDALALTFDMLHVDGNHDTPEVLRDLALHLPRLSSKGILVLDDIDWPSVQPAFDEAARCMTLVFKTQTYAIFAGPGVAPDQLATLNGLCLAHEAQALALMSGARPPLPLVSVSMIAYNQEKFIAQAIESVLAQRTAFSFELVISDDGSSDRTAEIIDTYARQHPGVIRRVRHGERLGAVRNYLRTCFACKGKYVAMLEGDDFWTDPSKLARQVAFLEAQEDHVISCHNVWKTDETGALGALLLTEVPPETQTKDLASGDYIATASCMFRATAIHREPEWLFTLPGCDWPFDMMVSQAGRIGYMPRPMAAYRQHSGGIWTSRSSQEKNLQSLTIASQADLATGYRHSAEFNRFRSRIWAELDKEPAAEGALIILDEAFPHPQSGFRMEELTAYLETFSAASVYATGEACEFFRPFQSLERAIAAHNRHHPELQGRIVRYRDSEPLRAKLAYTIFASNAWRHLKTFERDQVPFVFTLYPGGGFLVNDAVSDSRLRDVFSSPMFRRVIVTQVFVRNYLIEKGLCAADRIALIYGVVTPAPTLAPLTKAKARFGYGKETLDICFTAHKYMPSGRDKGYDVFLDVARRLASTCPEAMFHVAGGFAETDLPIDGLEGRIRFYGAQDQSWFRTFYQDKDLILLANEPFILGPGAFDGFPTGCGSDAMLCETALLCTDPLGMNIHFTDGQDLILIRRDVDEVVQRIVQLRAAPHLLRQIGEMGARTARDVYSLQRQVGSRIELLAEELSLLSSSAHQPQVQA